MDYRVEVLSDVPGLWDVSPTALAELAESFQLKVYASGSWVCREGEGADRIYILGDGEVDVIKTSPAGRLFTVATLTPGSLFGHVGLVTHAPRTASVRARGEAVLLEMPAMRAQDLIRGGRFEIASPFRRALIVALSRQLNAATATTMGLATDAGVTSPSVKPTTEPPGPEAEPPLPADATEQLLKAQGQV